MPVPVAPSPVQNEMGNFVDGAGCTFRTWAIFATAASVKVLGPGAAATTYAMARDLADGFGNDVWSVFVPGIAEGIHYRYVFDVAGGGNVERVDPFARSIVFPNWTAASRDDSDARSVVTARNHRFGQPFAAPGWRELVIYQLHVGTFYDAANPGLNTIQELIAQVPYLKDLGVNAVQFLPFSEFSADLSLGYDPVQPYAMERDYGTPQDFADLVQALHDAGMCVLVDLVYNHVDVSVGGGPALPYSLFRYDGWSGNDCGIFFYGGDEKNTPFGGPRPDYGRDAVRRYLRDNVRMWLEEYRADGIRLDSTGCIRKRQGPCGDHCCGADLGAGRNFGWELMQEINDWVDTNQSWKLTIAEDLDGNAAITAPHSAGGAGFDAQWDTGLQDALVRAITQPNDLSVDVGAVARAMEFAFEGDRFKRIIYLESHDQAKNDRVPGLVAPGNSEGWHARKKSMLGLGVALTTPGIPMFFQGAELLDWRRWAAGGNAPTNMDFARRTRFSRYFQFYADMVRLRKNHAGLAGDGLRIIQANGATKVLAYQRANRGAGVDDLLVVANFSGTSFTSYTLGFPYPGDWHVRLNSDANVYSDSNDFQAVHCYDTTAGGSSGWDGMPFSGNVAIGPYSFVIFGR